MGFLCMRDEENDEEIFLSTSIYTKTNNNLSPLKGMDIMKKQTIYCQL